MRIWPVVVALVLALLPDIAHAGPYEDALRAHDDGRYDVARELLLPLAEAGNVDAQNKLSHMNWYGEGAPSDYEAAEFWSRKAAAQGSATAHFDIGAHYYAGTGVPKSVEQGFEWQLKSAELGDPWGARNMAAFYQFGVGTEPDIAKSAYWRRRALDMGDPTTQMLSALDYLPFGDMGRPEAERLLIASATQRTLTAQLILGQLLLEGDAGWTPDVAQAHFWLSVAAAGGCLEARALAKRAEADMSAAEIADSTLLVQTWQEANPAPLGSVHPVEQKSCHPGPSVEG